MRRNLFAAAMLAGVALSPGDALAACQCRCVNGEMRPICSNSIEIPPICPPTICPIVPPSIAPITTPRVPPVGTQTCRQVQILNPATGRYEWREVCR